MRRSVSIAALAFTAWLHAADASVQVHVGTSKATATASHTRTLSAELDRALASVQAPSGYTLDVAFSKITSTESAGQVDVRVEVRAFLSDDHGRVQWASTARALAQGAPRERTLVERDAIAAVADQLANHVRTRIASR